jgi:hypothetical protein
MMREEKGYGVIAGDDGKPDDPEDQSEAPRYTPFAVEFAEGAS